MENVVFLIFYQTIEIDWYCGKKSGLSIVTIEMGMLLQLLETVFELAHK